MPYINLRVAGESGAVVMSFADCVCSYFALRQGTKRTA